MAADPEVKRAKLAEILGKPESDLVAMTKGGHMHESSKGCYPLGAAIREFIDYLTNTADVRQLNEQLLRERVEKTRHEKIKIERANAAAMAAAEDPPVAITARASLRVLCKLSSTDAGDAKVELDQAGIKSKPGPKGADLYPLLPAMRLLVGRKSAVKTVQESIIERNTEAARKDRLTCDKLESILADTSELMAAENELFEMIAATIRTSELSEARKEDIFSAMRAVGRKFGEGAA